MPIPLGRFLLDDVVGSGGAGIVFRARHLRLDLPVAVKVLPPKADRLALHAHKNEVQAVARLHHPHVVAILDAGSIDAAAVAVAEREGHALAEGSPYLAVELASGGDLHMLRPPLPWGVVSDVLRTLLSALAHAHARGVVHKDLKPQNVLLCTDDDVRPGLKLTDFGLALHERSERLDGGTPLFMAPEQFDSDSDLGSWTDLYALGCMAHWLATGAPPFVDDSWRKLAVKHVREPAPRLAAGVDAPEGFTDWVARLLEKNPALRYRCAADADAALAELDPTRPPPPRDRLPDGIANAGRAFDAADDTADVAADAATVLRSPLADTEVLPPRGDERRAPWEGVAAPVAERGAAPGARSEGGAPPAMSTSLPSQTTQPPEVDVSAARPPSTWRAPQAPLPDLRLIDAGLSLWGLRPVPLVGREAERDALWGALLAVHREPGPRVAALVGPSGVGKSRLAEWIAHRAKETGAAVVLKATFAPIAGRGDGLAAMVARECGLVDVDAPGERARLWLHRWLPREDISVDELCALAGAAPSPWGSAEERHATLIRFLAARARERPLLVWLDDVQHGKDALALVDRVLRDAPELRVLFVVTAVDELLDEDARQRLAAVVAPPGDDAPLARDPATLPEPVSSSSAPDSVFARLPAHARDVDPGAFGPPGGPGGSAGMHAHVAAVAEGLALARARAGAARGVALRLAPLDEGAHDELCARLLGGEAGGLADEVRRRTEGNPLFAVHLVGDWVARGLLEMQPGGLALKPGTSPELPDALHALWDQRITMAVGEGGPASEAIEIAAVLGSAVDFVEWEAAVRDAGLDVTVAHDPGAEGALALDDVVDTLVDNGLGRRTEGGFAFAHALVRGSVERRARENKRLAGHHASAARALSSLWGTDTAAAAARIGRHLLAAGARTAALQPLQVAARAALEEGDALEAAGLLVDWERARAALSLRRQGPPGGARPRAPRAARARGGPARRGAGAGGARGGGARRQAGARGGDAHPGLVVPRRRRPQRGAGAVRGGARVLRGGRRQVGRGRRPAWPRRRRVLRRRQGGRRRLLHPRQRGVRERRQEVGHRRQPVVPRLCRDGARRDGGGAAAVPRAARAVPRVARQARRSQRRKRPWRAVTPPGQARRGRGALQEGHAHRAAQRAVATVDVPFEPGPRARVARGHRGGVHHRHGAFDVAGGGERAHRGDVVLVDHRVRRRGAHGPRRVGSCVGGGGGGGDPRRRRRGRHVGHRRACGVGDGPRRRARRGRARLRPGQARALVAGPGARFPCRTRGGPALWCVASSRRTRPMARNGRSGAQHTLAIDIGGTGLKASVLDEAGKMVTEKVRVETPHPCGPKIMVDALDKLVKPLPPYHRVSVGFPGLIRHGRIITAPNLGTKAFAGFDLSKALSQRLGAPVRAVNDADMQGLAAIRGRGVEMAVTLGTGFGTALFHDGKLQVHLEIAHHPFKKERTYDELLGDKHRKKLGAKKWSKLVKEAIKNMRTMVNFDHLFIGGGNARRIDFKLPKGVSLVDNSAGILGGIKLWDDLLEDV